jgi:hypothetical protein
MNGNETSTQSVEAIVELLKFLNKPADPLPEAVQLTDMILLVLSNKKDSYYVVTPKACSCPSFIYRGGPCKHQRKYFAETRIRGQTIAETLEEADRNLWKMPKSYQRMVRQAREEAEAGPPELIKHGGFKPIHPEDSGTYSKEA